MKNWLISTTWGEIEVYDIITTGSATVDVFAHTASDMVKFVTNEGEEDFLAYPSGSKLIINNLEFHVGGGGTNTAVSFARLGLNTAYLGKLGNDTNAQKVLDLLDAEGIQFIGAQKGQTGYSVILDTLEKDRTILTFKGANDQLLEKDILLKHLDARWLYSSSLTGESQHTLNALVDICKRKNIKFAFNPSNYQAKQGYEKLKHIIDSCTALIMNNEEAEMLFAQQDMSGFIREHPKMYIAITDGGKGVIVHYEGKQIIVTPTPHHTVVETTGAGDAFASGFVAGLAHQLELTQAITLGMVQAESVIGAIGAKNNLLIKEVAFQRMERFAGTIDEQNELFAPEKPHRKEEHALPKFYESTQEQGFHLESSTITGLEELGFYLKFTTQEEFEEHVSSQHNYFADWIEHVFDLPLLSQQLRTQQTKEEQSKTIIDFVHRGGEHGN